MKKRGIFSRNRQLIPLTHLKSEHLPPDDARSCGILGNQEQCSARNGLAQVNSSQKKRKFSPSQEESGRGRGAKNAPLLDPPSGGARRAAKRLRLRVLVLRRVVVLVAPRSGGRRRVLHRLPSLPSCLWRGGLPR